MRILEVGGVSQFVKPPTGKSFRFVRACERARRGEAVWASERRFDCEARAVVRQTGVLFFSSSSGETMPGGLSTKKIVLAQVFDTFFADNPSKTNEKTTLLADNLIKPLKKQLFSQTTL